jgi:hypothetical protein
LNAFIIVLMVDSPSDGDVLITTEGGRHFLSVVPHPHRLSLSEYAIALQIAKRWAKANNAAVWRTAEGVATKLAQD